MKDNFSGHAQTYAQYRPSYPYELGKQLAALAPATELVWDCATGNGQMATVLADHFKKVVATDLSAAQLDHAIKLHNIEYRCEPSHTSSLANHSADAVVVAQAVHWFPFDAFYNEVLRVVRPGGLVALLGYPLLEPMHPAVQNALLHFYEITVGPYWDPERRLLDDEYTAIPFPFEEIPFEPVYMRYNWDLPTIVGYLNSWSAVQHYIKQHGLNPVDAFEHELEMVWPKNQEKIGVLFKIVGRLGRV
jgi:SAM-dependent methyltransferase